MEIQLTWHLLVMIVITVLLIIGMIRDFEEYTFAIYGFLLFVACMIYGGVFFW